MRGFAKLPKADAFRLLHARIPQAFLRERTFTPDADGLVRCDLTIVGGKIASLVPAGMQSQIANLPTYDLDQGIVLPRLVDIHTHLDKGHIWPRAFNSDGSFSQAVEAVDVDRQLHWSEKDLEARMEFALRCAYAHGTGAIRTHLDSLEAQTAVSWQVFAGMREQWKDRIALQAVSLYPIDFVLDAPEAFQHVVATTALHGGVLGGVTYLGHAPDERTRAALTCIFEAAERHDLDLDFHVDESGEPTANTLELIAELAISRRFPGRILAGHCCSLALREKHDFKRISDRLLEAKMAVVALPLCNMYLQDRKIDHTPRWRGVAPLHELATAGVSVMIASDNTRDPFYAYGDLDLIEVARESTRILHLDHGGPDWAAMLGPIPASLMNVEAGLVAQGYQADLILTRARTLNEFFSRPQSDRTVLVAGRTIDRTLPDYRELDDLYRKSGGGS